MKDNTVINTEYNYDNNGNQTSVKQLSSEGNKTSTYEYDGFNQMVKSKTPEGKSLTCNYDAQGLRVSKTVDGKTTNYYYRYSSVILENRHKFNKKCSRSKYNSKKTKKTSYIIFITVMVM